MYAKRVCNSVELISNVHWDTNWYCLSEIQKNCKTKLFLSIVINKLTRSVWVVFWANHMFDIDFSMISSSTWLVYRMLCIICQSNDGEYLLNNDGIDDMREIMYYNLIETQIFQMIWKSYRRKKRIMISIITEINEEVLKEEQR